MSDCNMELNNNVLHNLINDFSKNIILEVVKQCSEIHNFNVDETMNKLTNNTNITTSEPVKKKRGRPKKVKPEIISNGYTLGHEDPIVKKLLNAMASKKSNEENLVRDDELVVEEPINDDEEEEIETEFIEYKGVKYLLASDNSVYENHGDNSYIGKWNNETKSIIA